MRKSKICIITLIIYLRSVHAILAYETLAVKYSLMANTRARASTIHDNRYRTLVNQLVELRQNAGLKQIELAELLGITQPDISKIERFERRLDALELVDWLKFVEFDFAQFGKKFKC